EALRPRRPPAGRLRVEQQAPARARAGPDEPGAHAAPVALPRAGRSGADPREVPRALLPRAPGADAAAQSPELDLDRLLQLRPVPLEPRRRAGSRRRPLLPLRR